MTKRAVLQFSIPICLVLAIHCASMRSFAQSDADVGELERLKKIAEARKAIAEAQRAEVDARFPKPDASALVGGTKVSGDFIESTMLGYCAMKTAAKAITDKIHPPTGVRPFGANSKFIVYQEADVRMLSRYQLMIRRLSILEDGYTTLCSGGACTNPSGVVAKGIGVGLVVNKALEYLSLLKTDVDITGTEVSIGEKELVAELFNSLPTYELYYPQRVPLGLTTFRVAGVAGASDTIDSVLFDKIVSLGQAYDLARNLSGSQPQRDRLDLLYNSTMTELGLGEIPTANQGAGGMGAGAACPGGCTQTTNVSVNVGEKEKEAGGGGGGDKTFYGYLQAEKLYYMMIGGSSYWLDLQVVKAGGNMRVRSNFITNFITGSRVNFSGGAVVYFNVFDRNGVSKVSGVVSVYENYRKSSKVNATCG